MVFRTLNKGRCFNVIKLFQFSDFKRFKLNSQNSGIIIKAFFNAQLRTMLFLRALLSLILLFLVNSEPLRPLQTWYFFGNQNVSSSGDEALPQIVCFGPLCSEVEIRTVKCEAISFEADYKCHSPDISSEDNLKGNYSLHCIDRKFEQENCYVEVVVEADFSSIFTQKPPAPMKSANSISFVNLVIAFILSQMVLSCCIAPVLYFLLRPPKKASK